MGIEEMGRVALSDRNSIREAGSGLSKAVAQLVKAEVDAKRLTVLEAWLVLVGTLYGMGKSIGMGSSSMIEHVRISYRELDRLHGGSRFSL